MIQNDKKAHVTWCEDNTTSIEDVEILQLETTIPEEWDAENDQTIPEKKKKFNLQIKPSSKIPGEDDEIEFHHTASSLPVDNSTPGKTSSRTGAWSQHNLALILSMISSKVSLCWDHCQPY